MNRYVSLLPECFPKHSCDGSFSYKTEKSAEVIAVRWEVIPFAFVNPFNGVIGYEAFSDGAQGNSTLPLANLHPGLSRVSL
jgi:hypothetical protein